MKIKIFNWEKFDRSKYWYIIFASIFILIFILSAFYKNIVWIILMFFLLWAYIYYWIINIHETDITISNNWIIIENNILPWNNLIGFCIEIDIQSKNIKNIVFITHKWHNIYTINDTIENVQSFINELEQFIPMLQDFPQSFWEKLARKMKL